MNFPVLYSLNSGELHGRLLYGKRGQSHPTLLSFRAGAVGSNRIARRHRSIDTHAGFGDVVSLPKQVLLVLVELDTLNPGRSLPIANVVLGYQPVNGIPVSIIDRLDVLANISLFSSVS